jgi:hypothetical protein
LLSSTGPFILDTSLLTCVRQTHGFVAMMRQLKTLVQVAPAIPSQRMDSFMIACVHDLS